MDASALRTTLIEHSLFPPTTLSRAVERLGFIQADPIRSPARSQDLILRHRVKNYRAGDLEKQYPKLGLEEDYTFAYGFLRLNSQALLHPRPHYELTKAEEKVIDAVRTIGKAHPKEIQERCGGESVRNGWGGKSKQAKQALETAHHHGHLRVARRDKGIRVYEIAEPIEQSLSPSERLASLLLLQCNLFGPTSEAFLLKESNQYAYLVQSRAERRKLLRTLVDEGALGLETLNDIDYIMPKRRKASTHRGVKLLAPFDPIVRDRNRFEQLWGWVYRFEAYTPAAKRERGYYALPLLWKEDVIGWANVKVVDDTLHVEIGYEQLPKAKRAFAAALEQELSAFARFMHLEENAWTYVDI